MTLQSELECVVNRTQIFCRPYIARLPSICSPCLLEMQVDAAQKGIVLAKVEDSQRSISIGQRTRPDLDGTFREDALPLLAEGILIDGDDLSIGENGGDLRRQLIQVVARQQRSSKHGPHAHVRTVLIESEFPIADLQHIGIVPMPWSGILREARLSPADQRNAIEAWADVAGSAPKIAADLRGPLPAGVVPVLAGVRVDLKASLRDTPTLVSL